MKPDDVTDAMVCAFRSTGKNWSMYSSSEMRKIITAAFNAVVSDAEPITAERLVAMGHERSCTFKDSFYHMESRQLRIWFGSKGSTHIAIGETAFPTKTIGQLLALHAGLGIGEVQS